MNLILRILFLLFSIIILNNSARAQRKITAPADTSGRALKPGAQQNTTKKGDNNTSFIEILESEYTDILKSGNENITKIVGNVKLRSGTDILYCDSAVLFQEKKIAEAFGNVSIEQADGTTAFADYLKYTGGSKVVYMKGDVVLSDPKNNTLWSDEVDYNLSTKIGKFHKDGTLQNEQTVLTAKKGEYNLKTKEARFKGDVVVNDPEYKATSEDLGYNTDTRLVRFFDNGIVQSDATTLFPKTGSTYDAAKKFANFKGRSNIIHESRFIEADDMKYNQETGWAFGQGKVIAIDTAEKATIWCGQILYNDKTGKMQATIKPIIRRAGEDDTAYQRSDTVFSEPLANLERPDAGAIDTAKLEMDRLIDILTKGVEVDSLQVPFLNDTSELDLLNLDEIPTLGTDDSLLSENDNIATVSDSTNIRPADTLVPQKEILGPFLKDYLHLDSSLDIVASSPDTLSSNVTDTLVADSLAIASDDSLSERPRRPENKIGKDPGSRIYEKSDAAKNGPDDENKPRYFLLYHNVLVFSDSAQAKGDSLRYSQADSLMILYNDPVIWGKGAQITGDTIYALIDSNKIHEVFVPKNAILIQQNGPEKADMFDQVQGAKIHAFFVNNELDSALAYPNAETIYFPVDDDSAYIGASKASSDRLRMQFKERKIKRIHYLKDFSQTMTPMKDVEPAAFRLERFNWRENERPGTLNEFLAGAEEWQKKEILGAKYYEIKEMDLSGKEGPRSTEGTITPSADIENNAGSKDRAEQSGSEKQK